MFCVAYYFYKQYKATGYAMVLFIQAKHSITSVDCVYHYCDCISNTSGIDRM